MYGKQELEGTEAFRKGQTPTQDQVDAARNNLLSLHRARWDLYTYQRGRIQVKRYYMTLVLLTMLMLLIALGFAIQFTQGGDVWEDVLITATAGAGRLHPRRRLQAPRPSHEDRGAPRLRAACPAPAAIGAIAGVFVLFVVKSGILRVSPGGL